jgi:hypothetical protein
MRDPSVAIRKTNAWSNAGALLLLLCLMGCDQTPTTPTPPPARVATEGTWTGTITDRTAGSAQLSMTVSGIETLGLGTFMLTFPDAAANARGILQSRTQDTSTIELILFVDAGGRDCSGAPGISYIARLTLAGNRMTGTYGPAVACPLLGGGSMELTRR